MTNHAYRVIVRVNSKIALTQETQDRIQQVLESARLVGIIL